MLLLRCRDTRGGVPGGIGVILIQRVCQRVHTVLSYWSSQGFCVRLPSRARYGVFAVVWIPIGEHEETHLLVRSSWCILGFLKQVLLFDVHGRFDRAW